MENLQVIIGKAISLPPTAEAAARDPILAFVQPAGDVVRLSPANDGLEGRLKEALDGIGSDASVEIVPIDRTRSLAARLSPDALLFVRLELDNAIDRSLNWLMASTLPDMLSDRYANVVASALGDGACERLRVQLWKDVVLANLHQGRRDIGALAERLLLNAYAALYYRTALELAGMQETAIAVERFAALSAAGHHPIGLLADRTFLVITG
jgi:hypothetical protein